MKDVEEKPYEEQLMSLGVSSLEKRRLGENSLKSTTSSFVINLVMISRSKATWEPVNGTPSPQRSTIWGPKIPACWSCGMPRKIKDLSPSCCVHHKCQTHIKRVKNGVKRRAKNHTFLAIWNSVHLSPCSPRSVPFFTDLYQSVSSVHVSGHHGSVSVLIALMWCMSHHLKSSLNFWLHRRCWEQETR